MKKTICLILILTNPAAIQVIPSNMRARPCLFGCNMIGVKMLKLNYIMKATIE